MKKILNLPHKELLLIFPIFLVGMFLGSFGYSKYLSKNVSSGASDTNQKLSVNYPLPEVIEEKRETSKNAKLLNILLLGHGGDGHSGGGLMDAIILVSVNLTDKKATVISIPRDLWFSGHKINADPSIKDAVADITGLSIENYISIDFTNFKKLIDSLDGISVDVKKAYIDNFYPVKGLENELCGFSPEKIAELHQTYSGFELEKQFTCRYETIDYSIGLNNMNGEETLKYVRSRHGDGDFGRSRRQFEVLKAILQKANVKSLSQVLKFVSTTIDLDEANLFLDEIGNPLSYSVSYLGITDENVLTSTKSSNGAFILVPKEGQSIKSYIDKNM